MMVPFQGNMPLMQAQQVPMMMSSSQPQSFMLQAQKQLPSNNHNNMLSVHNSGGQQQQYTANQQKAMQLGMMGQPTSNCKQGQTRIAEGNESGEDFFDISGGS